MKAKIGIIFVLPIGIFLSFLYWAQLPADGHVSYVVNGVSNTLTTPSKIKILTFNIAYGRGPEDDILTGPKSETAIKENLAKISRFLKNTNADVILLQEVDFASQRTHFTDEARHLAENADYPSYACVTNWVKNYIPFPYWPPSKHFGRMKSGQCIMSKFPIKNNKRISLPQRKDKPFFYTAFDLTRAVQVVEIVIDGEAYNIFNVHLEAFDIKNREEQAEILANLTSNSSVENIIVGGDFNSLPPQATTKKNFPDNPEKEWKEWGDVSGDRALKLFTSRAPKVAVVFTSDFPESETFTFPSDKPNRQLDYIFFSKNLISHRGRVLREAGTLSDHLPVYMELELLNK